MTTDRAGLCTEILNHRVDNKNMTNATELVAVSTFVHDVANVIIALIPPGEYDPKLPYPNIHTVTTLVLILIASRNIESTPYGVLSIIN